MTLQRQPPSWLSQEFWHPRDAIMQLAPGAFPHVRPEFPLWDAADFDALRWIGRAAALYGADVLVSPRALTEAVGAVATRGWMGWQPPPGWTLGGDVDMFGGRWRAASWVGDGRALLTLRETA